MAAPGGDRRQYFSKHDFLGSRMSLIKLVSNFFPKTSFSFTRLIQRQIDNPVNCCSQVRGFKDKPILQLRCSGCYYKKIDDRWWVLCKTHPRHMQREKVNDVKSKWILTHMTIGGRPFQKKETAYICNLAPPGPYDYKHKVFFKPNPKEVVLPRKIRPGLHRKLLIPWR